MLRPGDVVDLNVVVAGCRNPGIHLRDQPDGSIIVGYCTSSAIVVARVERANNKAHDVLLLPCALGSPLGWAHEDVVEGNGLWR